MESVPRPSFGLPCAGRRCRRSAASPSSPNPRSRPVRESAPVGCGPRPDAAPNSRKIFRLQSMYILRGIRCGSGRSRAGPGPGTRRGNGREGSAEPLRKDRERLAKRGAGGTRCGGGARRRDGGCGLRPRHHGGGAARVGEGRTSWGSSAAMVLRRGAQTPELFQAAQARRPCGRLQESLPCRRCASRSRRGGKRCESAHLAP